MSRFIALGSFVGLFGAMAACGSSSSTTGTTSTASTSTTSTTTSSSTTTSTSGGGSSSSTTTTSSGMGGAGGTGGSTSTGMGGAGGAGMGACTNAADQNVFATKMVSDIAQQCAINNGIGMEPGTSNCIKMMTGLSDGCTACVDEEVKCGIKNCITQCIGGASPACTMCLDMNCTPAFHTCSGL